MVYCGKPSKGCQSCRERKIRCDQVPEGCGQCAKQKIVCPGYRDQIDLMFRNESSNVARKVKARQIKLKQGSSTASKPADARSIVKAEQSQSWTDTDYDLDLVHARHLSNFSTSTIGMPSYLSSLRFFSFTPTLEERATSFFVSNFVIGHNGRSRGHLASLSTNHSLDDTLMASIKAVGLAGFSNVENSPAVMKQARIEYANALRLTNAALRSPTEAKRDSTLLSVMILSIYETVTGTSQKSLKAWELHTRGASALVKLRGKEQIQSLDGRHMVIQVISNLLISCIQRELALPDYILELRAEIKKLVDPTEPAWQVQDAMVQFCEFRAQARDGTLTDLRVILAKALEIEGQFLDIFTDPPLQWRYETRYLNSDPENVWNGCYHIYSDYWVAQIWNAMRTCRIMLNESIRDTLLQGFQMKPPVFFGMEHSAQFQLSTDVLYQMQTDILASVPQHIGFTPKAGTSPSTSFPRRPEFPKEDSSPPIESQPVQFGAWEIPPIFNSLSSTPLSTAISDSSLPVLRASGGYFLLWPLFLAAVVDVASEESRQWAMGRLRYIGRAMGIGQAIVLAGVVEHRSPIRAWLTRQKDVAEMRQGPYMEPLDTDLDDDDDLA